MMWSSRRFAAWTWLVVLLTRSASTAEAAQEGAAPSSPAGDGWVTTVRLQAPLSRLFFWSPHDGVVAAVGGSLNGRFAGLFEVEAGADDVISFCDHGWLFTGRAGISPPLRRAAARGSAWEVRLPLLAGYHHTHLPPEGCEYSPATTLHAVSVSAGVDATYWTAGRWGLNMRLLGGAGRAWEETEDRSGHRTNRVDRLWDLSLAVGVSF